MRASARGLWKGESEEGRQLTQYSVIAFVLLLRARAHACLEREGGRERVSVAVLPYKDPHLTLQFGHFNYPPPVSRARELASSSIFSGSFQFFEINAIAGDSRRACY